MEASRSGQATHASTRLSVYKKAEVAGGGLEQK